MRDHTEVWHLCLKFLSVDCMFLYSISTFFRKPCPTEYLINFSWSLGLRYLRTTSKDDYITFNDMEMTFFHDNHNRPLEIQCFRHYALLVVWIFFLFKTICLCSKDFPSFDDADVSQECHNKEIKWTISFAACLYVCLGQDLWASLKMEWTFSGEGYNLDSGPSGVLNKAIVSNSSNVLMISSMFHESSKLIPGFLTHEGARGQGLLTDSRDGRTPLFLLFLCIIFEEHLYGRWGLWKKFRILFSRLSITITTTYPFISCLKFLFTS